MKKSPRRYFCAGIFGGNKPLFATDFALGKICGRPLVTPYSRILESSIPVQMLLHGVFALPGGFSVLGGGEAYLGFEGIAEIHIGGVAHPPELAINAIAKERYTAIGNYAREKNVTIAFENLKYTKNLEFIMSAVPDAKFCWDCGHEYSRLADEKPMPLFRDKLAALHIHDNFITSDDHLIPFTGKVDFDYVAKELAQSGFDGTLMLEILYGRNKTYTTEPTYREFACKAKLAAEKLIDLVEKYRGG